MDMTSLILGAFRTAQMHAILCWVWNPRSLEHLNMDPDPNKQSSPRHFENAVWYAAARRAGVKIIVTFSNVCAADGHRIGPRDYKTEIDSRAFVGADYIKGPDYEFDEALKKRCKIEGR